jgi:integrase/recombinase XerC
MLQNFESYLQYEKRYSIHTVKAYVTDLQQLGSWLLETYDIKDVSNADYQHLRSWLAELFEQGNEARTLHRKISAVRAYFRYLRKFHNLEVDPTKKISVPKIPSKLPVYVEEEQMEVLLGSDVFNPDFEGCRDRAIIELFYQTGLRCAELVGIKIFDLDLQRGTLKVLGKRNKERIVPVGEAIHPVLIAYMNEREKLKEVINNDYFFLTKRGVKIYPRLVYNIVNIYLSRVSYLRKKSPHVLRHTFATHMLNRGAELNAIKELLGHTSLAATQVYTHNSIDKLKEIHRKAHPKG